MTRKRTLIMGIILLLAVCLFAGCAKQTVDSDKPVSGRWMTASERAEYLLARREEAQFNGGKELPEEEVQKAMEYYHKVAIDTDDYGESVAQIIAGAVFEVDGEKPVILEYDGTAVWDNSNFDSESSTRLKGEELEQWFASLSQNTGEEDIN